jgi:predicted RNA-binding Zn ribbon-like protein
VDLATDLINCYATAAQHEHVEGKPPHPVPDLAEFLAAHEMDPSGVSDDHQQAVRHLADRLHEVFTASDPARAVAVVNGVLSDVGAMPQISGHDDEDWHLHYHPVDANPIDRLAATAAMGLATVLCTAGVRRFGHCACIDCNDVYVDTSHSNRRRFCSDGCANRTHVAAHRARHRSADG